MYNQRKVTWASSLFKDTCPALEDDANLGIIVKKPVHNFVYLPSSNFSSADVYFDKPILLPSSSLPPLAWSSLKPEQLLPVEGKLSTRVFLFQIENIATKCSCNHLTCSSLVSCHDRGQALLELAGGVRLAVNFFFFIFLKKSHNIPDAIEQLLKVLHDQWAGKREPADLFQEKNFRAGIFGECSISFKSPPTLAKRAK